MLIDTKDQLLELIKRRGTLSVDEAAKQTGLAKTTLREHFLQLESDSYIQRDYIRNGPGRPKLQYQLTPEGNRLFPSSESDLIRELIKYLKSQGDEDTLEGFFRVFWEERLEKAQRQMNKASKQDKKSRVEALSQMLEEEGFMPEFDIDEDAETLTVKECNCPFSKTIEETRLPCKLEAMFYKQLFGDQTNRITHIAEGDHACTYEITLNK